MIFVLKCLGKSAEAQGNMVDTHEEVGLNFPSQMLNLVHECLQQVLAMFGCMPHEQDVKEIALDEWGNTGSGKGQVLFPCTGESISDTHRGRYVVHKNVDLHIKNFACASP